MDKKKVTANILLLVTSIIWGSSFVAQRIGMDYVGPFTFTVARSILAAIFLIPVMYFMDRGKKRRVEVKPAEIESTGEISVEKKSVEVIDSEKKYTLIGGIICGCVLFGGTILQQTGLVYTTAGKAGFITALYIVLIPIFSLVLRRKPELKAWVGVAFGTVGLYLLCITESFTIARGDLIMLIGACFWAAHLLVVDYFLPKISDPVKLSFVQFTVCSVLAAVGVLAREQVSLEALLACAVPILYAGILSGGVGFTLQIVGQRHTSPTVASLILSLEAVFGAVFGYLLLNELLTPKETVGCIFMFVAIIISQLPNKKKP